ncbi:uncharacterized protein BO95DRAFT_467386 [Aspergillus brunneoviolaceus CBS 621.78]|uniref:Uncharacterized protein n=1 Tax=Aspergillus brunneoviolaceus CBS 621.78 TaxID=1450534 RepID=A0ACD1FY73_9EURO|nr:hypothetical protein BO95DRAFT_467386 [Aspergillus brunneoviolaceus CBS 621.78]RAH41910.1 hypothetical protein BO95DRAFT_467386 [Aspergillus brunneoviolaceus CBS 621.78]
MSRREQQQERNESATPRQQLTEKESRDFRWIHAPVHNMQLAEVTAPMNKAGRTTQGETSNMTDPAGEDEESAALYIGELFSKSGGIEVSSKAAPSTTESKENGLALNVHERRTLDQYHYSIVADTTIRDREQVLSRYLEWRNSGNHPMTHSRKGKTEVGTSSGLSRKVPVLSVDQLWLWIVDDVTIVTASTCDFESFDDLVLEELVFSESRGKHPSPRTAPEMMETILRVITGPQMQSVSVKGNHNLKQPLEIFRDTIRLVAEEETKMTRAFIEEVVGASTGAYPLPRRDLGLEFQLLYEIKDIQNELDILLALTKTQESVCSSSYPTSMEDLAPSMRALRIEILAVQREAQSTRESINTLLDIRQKHTGNQDAEFGRQQAYTTMVFTIVTIVFLPLSFLTSLFALNVAVFPESPYPNQWIFPILFGCSAAFSIPAIVVALNVNELEEGSQGRGQFTTGDRPSWWRNVEYRYSSAKNGSIWRFLAR